MKRKRIILILIFVVVILTSYFYFVSKTKPISTTSPQKPKLPSYITGQLPIEISFKEEDFDFPSSLPTLSLSKRNITRDLAIGISQGLGIASPIQEFKDVNEGIKYFVNDGQHFFMATPRNSTVKYSMSAIEIPTTINKNISDNELANIATDFLIKNGFYSKEQVKPLPVLYYKEGSHPEEGLIETSKSSAIVFQVSFVFNSSKYEIVTETAGSEQIFVQILPDGRIYNAEVLLIDNIQESQTSFALKAYQDLVNNIGEATLISLSGDLITPSELKLTDIVSLKIEKIKLAYYLEPNKENLLLPIFLLEGPAVIKGSSANSATLYIPAFK